MEDRALKHAAICFSTQSQTDYRKTLKEKECILFNPLYNRVVDDEDETVKALLNENTALSEIRDLYGTEEVCCCFYANCTLPLPKTQDLFYGDFLDENNVVVQNWIDEIWYADKILA